MTTVNQCMTGNVATVDASASCSDAVTLMVRRKIRHLPVVSSTGALCGIVTDRDLRHRLFAPDIFPSIGAVRVAELLSTVRVSDIMSTPVASVDSGTELREAARAMAEKKVGSLPVVERDRVVGIVTETDLLRHIVGADAASAEVEAIVVSYP